MLFGLLSSDIYALRIHSTSDDGSSDFHLYRCEINGEKSQLEISLSWRTSQAIGISK